MGVKDGVLSALKGLAIEGVIMCGGGIIDRAMDNLMKCVDLVCDYKSNDSWDKDTRDNTICRQSFTVSEIGETIPLNDSVQEGMNQATIVGMEDV